MLLFVELSASLMLMLIFSFVVTMISSVSSIDFIMLEMCLSYDIVLHSGQEEGGDSYRYSLRVSVI